MPEPRRQVEQAALTATTVILDGTVTISIYRDLEDPNMVSILIMGERNAGEIVHEVNVMGDHHIIDITDALRVESDKARLHQRALQEIFNGQES